MTQKRCLLFTLLFTLITTPVYAQWQVAILPYENRTGDPQQEWVSRGISESVLYALYKMPQIRLVDESFFEDGWKNAVGNAQLMNAKNIHVVIQGWYERTGNRLKVHTDIVEASNGTVRKTVITEAVTNTPNQAIDGIVTALIQELNVQIDPAQKPDLKKPITANDDAYRNTIQAIRAFRQATQYAIPHTNLLAKAEQGLTQALKQDPQNAHARYYLGRVYELRENMAEAEATYRKALTNDFEHVMARYHLAMLYKQQGRTAEALNELEQTLRQSPLDPDIQSAISGLFFNQYEQTFESLTQPLQDMVNAAPEDPTGYYELGNVYDELSRDKEAAHYFTEALKRDATLADAHFKLGMIYHRQNKHEKAVEHLQKAAEYGTQFNRVHYRLGEILSLLHRYPEATEQFSKAIEKEPNYLIPRYHLGVSQLVQGQTQKAFETFQKYADLTIDDARPHIQMGHIYRERNDIENAIKAYQKAIEISIVETEAHYHLAYLLVDQGNYADAIKHLKTVLRLQPDHPDALTIQQDIKMLESR